MADIEKTIDTWFGKLQKKVTGTISSFVAFFFFMIALGSFMTVFIITQWPQHAFWVVVGPAIAGIIAYYNRTFATAVFVLLIFLMFFF